MVLSGGWWWTSHSPTGSGPEGSSPNELRHGSRASLPLTPRQSALKRTTTTAMDGTDDAKATAYRVRARQYRPKGFADLIGQEPMVQTLTNAFRTGRIAQAYMLTGVRGVGKTTTARLIARALNYPGAPSIEMPELTPQCEAILESRHMDVIEMDAASNTGVDNMREIIDSV